MTHNPKNPNAAPETPLGHRARETQNPEIPGPETPYAVPSLLEDLRAQWMLREAAPTVQERDVLFRPVGDGPVDPDLVMPSGPSPIARALEEMLRAERAVGPRMGELRMAARDVERTYDRFAKAAAYFDPAMASMPLLHLLDAVGSTMAPPRATGPLLEFEVPCPMVRKRSASTGKMAEVPGWFNANHRYVPIVEHKMRELWRNAGMDAAVAAALPKGLTSRLFIECWIHPTQDRTYDAMNLYPSAKGIVDGLIGSKAFPGYGLAAGDDNKWVVGPLCLPGVKSPGNERVVVRVYELRTGELYPSGYENYPGRHKVTT